MRQHHPSYDTVLGSNAVSQREAEEANLGLVHSLACQETTRWLRKAGLPLSVIWDTEYLLMEAGQAVERLGTGSPRKAVIEYIRIVGGR